MSLAEDILEQLIVEPGPAFDVMSGAMSSVDPHGCRLIDEARATLPAEG